MSRGETVDRREHERLEREVERLERRLDKLEARYEREGGATAPAGGADDTRMMAGLMKILAKHKAGEELDIGTVLELIAGAE